MIASRHDIKRFAAFLVLLLVFILYTAFMERAAKIQESVEVARVNHQLNEINSLLLVSAIKSLVRQSRGIEPKSMPQNPFDLIAGKYRYNNYRGTAFDLDAGIFEPGWYFETRTSRVVYISNNSQRNRYFKMQGDIEHPMSDGLSSENLDPLMNEQLVEIKNPG